MIYYLLRSWGKPGINLTSFQQLWKWKLSKNFVSLNLDDTTYILSQSPSLGIFFSWIKIQSFIIQATAAP